MCDQSFLEGHLVLRVEHFSLLLQIKRLVVVLAELLMIILHLLHPIVLLFILFASLLLKIVASEVVQDLLLQLQALMADERLLFGVPGHAAIVFTHSIRNQVRLVAVEWSAVRHWLHLLGHGHEELLGGHQRVREVRVGAPLVRFNDTLGVLVPGLSVLLVLHHGCVQTLNVRHAVVSRMRWAHHGAYCTGWRQRQIVLRVHVPHEGAVRGLRLQILLRIQLMAAALK